MACAPFNREWPSIKPNIQTISLSRYWSWSLSNDNAFLACKLIFKRINNGTVNAEEGTFLWHKFWKSNGIINILFRFGFCISKTNVVFHTNGFIFNFAFAFLISNNVRCLSQMVSYNHPSSLDLRCSLNNLIVVEINISSANRYLASNIYLKIRVELRSISTVFPKYILIRLCFCCIFSIRWKNFNHLKFEKLPHIAPTAIENQRTLFKTVRRSFNRYYVESSKRGQTVSTTINAPQLTHIDTTNVECILNKAFAITRPYITIIVSIWKKKFEMNYNKQRLNYNTRLFQNG